jgi:hypothetical protein
MSDWILKTFPNGDYSVENTEGECVFSLGEDGYAFQPPDLETVKLITHCHNVYPRLIAVLKHCARGYQDEESEQLLGELGE